ncbi:GntR family transcriptional regulator [Chromohalobacter canadensis]|uniref:GntR family transcriptional regulator n=1 Tax=Chromohalobacter canadensis TaxID=141389 RepID=A0ABZ0YB64_9GAMM|nr:GntR family transcriptional regulator [Chromohalobacter canadensis]MCK0767972.1 GntR family transcriptional regulator [Chromohalobacter canadensis]MCT8467678.1 GntR family transcriptional regulator [Chromohalobacter canadensis]MCT8470574.1 GntR family transcriptional regulator [Chromohalobacter canadensis]MCT8498175.1 GntR family transcriptional regulator [Chromohalobacter canadensis]WQH08540.1 GntR family transcriptional regulator [Chromohalobacter canadensis]
MDPRFAQMTLDPDLATPLYHQLARQLGDAIEAGAWQAGEALPSERALAETLEVSRITARKALERLAEQGLIRRTHGSGTFIAPRFNQPLTRLTSFSELLTQRGFTPRSRWLSRQLGMPSTEEALRLGLRGGTQVARLKRLRLADDVVMAVEESCLPESILPEPEGVEQSLYATLEARGKTVERALQHLTAVNADAELAALAEVPKGEALLKVTRLGYLADGTPAELTITYCRTDYYDFMVELHRAR